MFFADQIDSPLISVVIPCYNHSNYLPRAIESVLNQSYKNYEIIVVDDGSVDETAEVAKKYNEVVYVYQKNSGLSAARNTGVINSKGGFVVFLDADDWLYKDALAINAHYLKVNESAAFVSGVYDRVYDDNSIQSKVVNLETNHYNHLLQSNYIGMIATVMFRRRVLEEFRYDTTLAACEDYDLYLRIARKYEVAHHTQKIAAYYIHSSNMSSNNTLMLTSVLKVLNRQFKKITSNEEKENLKKGLNIWKNYYCLEMYKGLIQKKESLNVSVCKALLKHKPKYLLKYFYTIMLNANR